MDKLRQAVERSKRLRQQQQQQQQQQAPPPPPANKEEPGEDEALRVKRMREKTERYRDLTRGRTDLVPRGSLVDFETKLNRPLRDEDELRQAERDRRAEDAHRRYGYSASFAPPEAYEQQAEEDEDKDRNKGEKFSAHPAIEELLRESAHNAKQHQ